MIKVIKRFDHMLSRALAWVFEPMQKGTLHHKRQNVMVVLVVAAVLFMFRGLL